MNSSINININQSSPYKSLIKLRIPSPQPTPTHQKNNKKYNAQYPHGIDNARNPLKHLQLDTLRFGLPHEHSKPIDSGNTMIDNTNKKNPQCIQRQAHFPKRTHLINTVINNPQHVQYCQDEGARAYERRPVQYEIKEWLQLVIAAFSLVVGQLRHVGDDQHAQVVQLSRDAERV